MNKKIVVIGGGIIGMSAALNLARRGAEVIVLEQNKIGQACSYGNAGWVTPCFALPLAMPGMILKSLKWMLDPQGPLYIKPALSSDLANWLFRFLKAMNQKQALQATEALVQISKKSVSLYKELARELPGEFDLQEKGLLMVAESSESFNSLMKELEYVGKFGVRGESWNANEVYSREPILKANIKGGVYFPDEVHLDPYQLMLSLKKRCLQLGVIIREDTAVVGFNSAASSTESKVISKLKIRSMVNSIGDIKGSEQTEELDVESVVLATGSWSKSLGLDLNLKIPILGGKGYSMILPKLEPDLKYPIMVLDRKLAITPHKDRLRIAGTLELVDQDFTITQRRANVILQGAIECLGLNPELKLAQVQDLWAGLRPCTPDGVPMIGYSPLHKNLVLACGHQMLGLQSGIGTGFLVADLIEGKKSELDSKVFDPNRF